MSRFRACCTVHREERVHVHHGAAAVARGREAHHGLDQAVEAFRAQCAGAFIEQDPRKLPGAVTLVQVDSPLPEPQHFSRLPDVAEPSDADLDALVEQATVDAYDEYEQLASLHAVIKEHLAVPFRTTVLGVEVTVTKIDLLSGSGIAAICSRGKQRQAIGILDLPLPAPPPAGAEWIDAYRHWAT
jgi:hypothetical protein